jgi:hypothetical protein
VDNDEVESAASAAILADVLASMSALGAHDLVLSLHRMPENNFTWDQTYASFITTLGAICEQATVRNITVHLRISMKVLPEAAAMVELVRRVGAPNLRLAPSLALLVHQQADPASLPPDLATLVELWCIALPACDAGGTLYSLHAPLASDPTVATRLGAFTRLAPSAAWLLDSMPTDWSDAYEEVRVLDAIPRE